MSTGLHDHMPAAAVLVQARVRWLQVLRAAQKPSGGGWHLDFDADCECSIVAAPACVDTSSAVVVLGQLISD